MADLLEFILNVVLEFLCWGMELWAGWRFFLPFLSSVAIVGLICWLVSNNAIRAVLSLPVLLAGLLWGIIWQIHGERKV
ncbi:MAG TPA: hypothetical protein VEC99_11085 [Clostridia bacterium]|nr:hypothetical protein [Clostridia bacterium]